MADETSSKPVTDSRFPGFNPEVEASHAATAAAAAAAEAATQAASAAAAAPPMPRSAKTVMLEVLAALNNRVGNHEGITALIKELSEL